MDKISSKCDCCGSFGYDDEFETVTIKIKKHPTCAIDLLFNSVSKSTPSPKIDLPKINVENPPIDLTQPKDKVSNLINIASQEKAKMVI